MHINNFDPNTFLWLLEKFDVPYVPWEWDSLRTTAWNKNPDKLNGMSVFGKYLSKMRLKQWSDKGWADTEAIQKKAESEKKQHEKETDERKAEATKRYEAGEISEAEFMTLTSDVDQQEKYKKKELPEFEKKVAVGGSFQQEFFDENNFISADELPDPAAELTTEDKIYLAMKWGRYYRLNELVALEKNYNDMMSSFDIQDADTINSLILICKTNLKMNQCLDCADLEGYQKLARVYESLRKSAKFTALQNKEAKGDFVDCIGNLVVLCEKEEGFIPRFATEVPQDKIDLAIKDSNDYVKKLVTEDLGFGQQIEDALKKIQIQKEIHDAEVERELTGEDPVLNDKDFIDFYNLAEEQKQ